MTSSIYCSEEYRLTEESKFVCRVVHLFSLHYDKGVLFTAKGTVTICTCDLPGSPPKFGSPYFPYDVNGLLSCPQIFVRDFQIPSNIRSKGVGRFAWYRIYSPIPAELRERTYVAGRLVHQDATPENAGRRDRLWEDLCGASLHLSEAVFTTDSESSDGHFRGPFTNPWQASKSGLHATLFSA
jgi:hypothetical protein